MFKKVRLILKHDLCYHFFSLKRLHLQHNHIRTIPFLKVLQGGHIVQEYSKTAMKRKQINTGTKTYSISSSCIRSFVYS
jgi:hypothetical protein